MIDRSRWCRLLTFLCDRNSRSFCQASFSTNGDKGAPMHSLRENDHTTTKRENGQRNPTTTRSSTATINSPIVRPLSPRAFPHANGRCCTPTTSQSRNLGTTPSVFGHSPSTSLHGNASGGGDRGGGILHDHAARCGYGTGTGPLDGAKAGGDDQRRLLPEFTCA